MDVQALCLFLHFNGDEDLFGWSRHIRQLIGLAAVGNGDTFCLGAVLLDLEDPSKVLARSSIPILEPEAVYEKEGFFGDVVFSCGVLVEGDIVKMYYGVADTSMACAELSLQEIMDSLTWE